MAVHRVGLVQMRCSADPAGNDERAEAGIREAARLGAKTVCLQELFRSLYFCQEEAVERFDLAEPIPGPTTERYSRLAKEIGVAIILPLFERRAPGVAHNTAVVIDAGGALLGSYRKAHIPDDPLYHEKFYFSPGDTGFRAFRTAHGVVAVLICWDQWFPEAARLAALAGAEIIFYPTAIGWHPREKEEWGERQHDAWRTVQRGHAVANGLYVAAVNRVGHEGPKGGGLEFWGRSFVAGPMGEVIAEAGGEERVLVADCDLGYLETVRRNWPFFRDRRVDAYAGLARRFGEASG
ncbi:MAG: carbon-nitrogen hydrolase [Planctomycetes bacterium]|nr:carbon-nitrogen hydrolase [Planctomycetota bacterium]